MGWVIRTVRTAALVAVLLGAVVSTASPAGALTQSVNGVVVAPLGTQVDSFDYDLHGVLVDGALGVAQVRISNNYGCCRQLTITTTDGSTLLANAGLPASTSIVPGQVWLTTETITVAGGTGRFAGAAGGGSLQGVTATRLPFVQLTAIQIAPAVIGSLTLQVTTP